MKSRVIVAAVIEKKGKILLGRKEKDRGPYPNKWLIPGGGVNLGDESLVEALSREVLEETGLKIEKLENLFFDEDYQPDKNHEMTHYIFLTFKVTPVDCDAIAGDDLEQVCWFDKVDLSGLELSDITVKLFKLLNLL